MSGSPRSPRGCSPSASPASPPWRPSSGFSGAATDGGTRLRSACCRPRDFGHRWTLAATHGEAHASAERYRSLVEIAGSVIVVLARDGRIMEFNREAVRVLGWPTGEAIGQDYLRLCVPASWRDMVGAGIRRALKGESVHGVEARMVTREGAERVFVS